MRFTREGLADERNNCSQCHVNNNNNKFTALRKSWLRPNIECDKL